MKVAVVGAGLAGLTGAWRCKQAGLQVQLFDPLPAGGKARTLEPVSGWKIEWGPHSFTERSTAVLELATELGLKPEPVGLDAKTRYLARNGRLRKAGPLALRWPEQWELLKGLFRKVDHAPDESVAVWARNQFGPQLATGPIAAMMKGIWACTPDEVEMSAGFPSLFAAVARLGRVFSAIRSLGRAGGTYTFPGGIGLLTSTLASHLDPPSVGRVVRLSNDHAQWRVHTIGGSERFDAVIIATEATEAARLLETIPQLGNADTDPASYSRLAESVVALGKVRYSPLLVAHWLSANAAYPRGFGYLSADPGPLLGTIFASDILSGRAPTGMRSFATMIGGSIVPAAANADEQQVRSWLVEEHRRLTGKSCSIDGILMVRHPRAVAIPSPGLAARLHTIRVGLPPRLVLAGSYLGAGAMPDAILSGLQAASLLQKSLHAP